ncbi:MAG TPA: PhzF family phenazine biosynthesis protein [Microbacterium sp.]|nr:PhzF family phenazine biosynthesis protein [Microbacterium sp.]
MSLRVDVVNVFVDESGAHGNPLGIVRSTAATRGHEQQIASELGFSETVFVEDVVEGTATARIFTPAQELPFAGHPTVGLAAWLHRSGSAIEGIQVPAGRVRVRIGDDLVLVTARPEWAPQFALDRLASASEVEAADPDGYGRGPAYVWAWRDEPAGSVRARMFAPDLGIREDEATGAAAMRLTAALQRDLEILQGAGSVIRTRVRASGREVELGGRVAAAGTVELPRT